ncbi:MAG: T9SS type A sorting domain-containing protein [Chitinophagaceae bacterium]|nr:T9SS type A sorting domain-containing protein [Chitinophagaceae bacterium]
MKKIYFLLMMVTILGVKFGMSQGVFRTAAAGPSNWNAAGSWTLVSGADGDGIPDSDDDVFIQSGHTITLTGSEACNNLNVSTGTTNATTGSESSLQLGSNSLNINGYLRCYFATVGTTPGTSTTSIGPANITITASSVGKLVFVGNSRNITNSGEWAASNTGATTAFGVEVAMNAGQTATMGTGIKASSFLISSGTLDASTNRVGVDNGTTGQGDVTVNAGATLASANTGGTGSSVMSRTGTVATGRGGTLTVNGTLRLIGIAPEIQMTTLILSGTVEYTASGVQTLATSSFTGAASVNTYTNLTLGGTSTKTLAVNTTVNGTLSMQGNATVALSLGAFTLTYGTIAVLEYKGSATQTTASTEFAASGTNLPKNLRIDNINDVNLHASRTLLGLAFTSGHLILGANNLTISILGSISGATSSSYVVTDGTGALIINGIDNNNFTFPVGPNTTLYHPVTINNAGLPDNFSVNLSSASAPACLPGVASVTETWNISEETPLGSNCTLTFDYTGAAVGGSYTFSGAQIVHCSGTTPDYHNGSATATTATGSGFTTFSPFGISNDPTVLPVKFGNVKAYQQGNGIKVDWSNLTESGVVNYTIERSANGQLFTPLGTVNPTANNSNRADYSYFDAAPLTGINFYRIQSLEVDGKKLFSTIVRVSTKAGQTDITIYPNPVSGNRVSFQATALPKGQYMVRVTNAAGQQVMSKSLLHTGGSVTEVLELPATIKTGMYNILLSGADIKLTKTFIIR